MSDPSAAHFTLSAAKTPPQPQGKAIYARDRRSLIFLASNMPALPPQKTYELWLIPVSGAPIPSGLFTPDAHGSATVINPPLPAGVEAKTFAVTVEPSGLSGAHIHADHGRRRRVNAAGRPWCRAVSRKPIGRSTQLE